MTRDLRHILPAARSRLVVSVLIVAYLASAIGFPVPHFEPAKIVGRPFACQGRGCGCLTAEDCRRACCCSSRSSLAITGRSQSKHSPAASPAGCSKCIGAQVGQSSRHTPSTVRTRSETADDGADGTQSVPATLAGHSEPHGPSGYTLVSGIMARQCRGLSTQWISTGAVSLPPPALCWCWERLFVGWATAGDERPLDLGHSPPVPPPRA
jgi:hypothetical protein